MASFFLSKSCYKLLFRATRRNGDSRTRCFSYVPASVVPTCRLLLTGSLPSDSANLLRWKRGSGTENAKHPSGRSGFRYLTPFSRPTLNRKRDKALEQQHRDISHFHAQRVCHAMHRQLIVVLGIGNQQVNFVIADKLAIVAQKMSALHDGLI
jgi:hypothetical protein